jgi:uncharacterized protein (DUF983 family)
MTSLTTTHPERDAGQAMLRGFRSRCPACGEGRLFGRFLTPVAACHRCGESMEGQRSHDLPPYLTIFIVGHIVVPLVLFADDAFALTAWQHLMIFLPLTAALALGLMQPIKGAVIGLQWAKRLHGFDPAGDIHERSLGTHTTDSGRTS